MKHPAASSGVLSSQSHAVIPGFTKLAPYMIRANPVFLTHGLHRSDDAAASSGKSIRRALKSLGMEAKEFNEIRELLSPVFAGNRVQKVIVFGSFARGSETRKSDLDLMIVMETKKRFFDRYDAFEEVYRLMKDSAIDQLTYTPEELENISHRKFIKRILKEGKIIYER